MLKSQESCQIIIPHSLIRFEAIIMYHQIRLRDNQLDSSDIQETVVIDTDGEVIFYPNFFSIEESDRLFSDLYSSINWKQDIIHFYGKKIPLPRLTGWYGDEGKSYTYSGIEQHPDPWTPTLKLIKSKAEEISKVTFNSVLLNLYRDGKDSVSWHSDDEPELGKNPIIASISFGATRRFSLKHKISKDYKIDINLLNGSLLLMKGETQHCWQHQIPKTSKFVGPRINLTFRIIKPV
ncbi:MULTISPECIES: alpha-ketoglutarate-dependent dioxygenase AlkB [unclassified Microcoleus]|uniref:alpha-ketoglutarate-dependent dioxygenase AlkB n=1 Tax=unclassified Microcoleus TaxID=2642155 RepID=UPI002FD03AC4